MATHQLKERVCGVSVEVKRHVPTLGQYMADRSSFEASGVSGFWEGFDDDIDVSSLRNENKKQGFVEVPCKDGYLFVKPLENKDVLLTFKNEVLKEIDAVEESFWFINMDKVEKEIEESGPYIAGVQGGQLPPPGKLNDFFSNIVFEFAGLFLVVMLVRNLKN